MRRWSLNHIVRGRRKFVSECVNCGRSFLFLHLIFPFCRLQFHRMNIEFSNSRYPPSPLSPQHLSFLCPPTLPMSHLDSHLFISSPSPSTHIPPSGFIILQSFCLSPFCFNLWCLSNHLPIINPPPPSPVSTHYLPDLVLSPSLSSLYQSKEGVHTKTPPIHVFQREAA